MGTDQRDERWWVEETCLIKTKRWNDSLMPVLDALCMLRSYYTWIFFFFFFERFQQWVGQWEVLQTQGRRGGRNELDEVSDYSTSSGTMKNYWMPFGSVLFMELHLWNTSLPLLLLLFLSLPLSTPPPLTSPTSNWRCHKGVQGQWFFKVKLTLMRSSRHMWTDTVAPTAPFSASLTKPQTLHPGVFASHGLTPHTYLVFSNFV